MSLEVFFLSIFIAFFNPPAQARELTEVTLDIATEKQGAEAKQEAFDQALLQATERLTEEILGPEKSARYWPTLQPKLLKNSTRFVLFVKGSAPEVKGGVTHIAVNMKLSPDSLETLLREEGAMSSGGTKVLPLVDVLDEKGGHYAWWTGPEDDKSASTQDLFKRFFARLSAKFKAKSIYALDPTNSSFRLSVPASYRSETLRQEDKMMLAQYLKADVVLGGRVSVARTESGLKLNYDLQLYQARSGRQIGESVTRVEPLSSDQPKIVQAALEQSDGKVLDELSGRLSEAIASGNLNLNVVKVQIDGPMSYRQQAEFKRQLEQLREIKVLKERLFEPQKTIFEAETAVNGSELAKAVQKAHFQLYTVSVESAQDDSLALSVRALSSASAQ